MANRIQQIEALGLLGSIDIVWRLAPGVNIISGGNGSGKSTLLRAVAEKLRSATEGDKCSSLIELLKIETSGPIENIITNFDSFDFAGSAISQIPKERLVLFANIADNLFAASGKQMDLNNGDSELCFKLGKLSLTTEMLSSGEKQVMRLFYNIALHPDADLMILDEPEISLQIEWQKVLLEYILLLNPDMQILVATHSPAILMNGWVDRVSEISDIVVVNRR